MTHSVQVSLLPSADRVDVVTTDLKGLHMKWLPYVTNELRQHISLKKKRLLPLVSVHGQ